MNGKEKGKVVKILDVQSGTSKAGKEWQKQTFVIDSESQYNNLLAIDVFGDKVQQINSLSIGDEVEVDVNISSREYNGKYYHSISLWNINTLSKTEKLVNKVKTDLDMEEISRTPLDDEPPF